MNVETVFFLVRHGEAEQNVRGILDSFPGNPAFGLTETGRMQVSSTAGRIVVEEVDHIFSSPLLRARETAEVIRETIGNGIVVRFDDRLRETDFGIWSGGLVRDFWERYPAPETRLDGNAEERLEGFRAMRVRLASFLNDTLSEHSGERIVLVSHGDPLEQIHGLLTGADVVASFSGWYPDKGGMARVPVPTGFRVDGMA